MNPDPLDRFLESARRGSASHSSDPPVSATLEAAVIRGFHQVRRDHSETLRTCAVVLRRAWIGSVVAAVPLLGWVQWFPPSVPTHRSALESLFDPPPDLDLSLVQP